MANTLANKVCVITGGANGIGFGIADCFLQNSVKAAIILDIDHEMGIKSLASLSSKHGDRVFYYNCDVTKDLEEIWVQLIEKYKYIDILINNAGCLDERNPRKTIELNTLAVINWSLKFWEHTRTDRNGKGGTIINISSTYGHKVVPYVPMYVASKFAIVGFTKSIGHAYNFDQYGVRVVGVCPGITKTKMSKFIRPWSDNGDFKSLLKSSPTQNVEDVSRAVIEIFENAKSGTVWVIDQAQPIVEV